MHRFSDVLGLVFILFLLFSLTGKLSRRIHVICRLPVINSSYYICGDFNIHVDVPVGDGYKFMTFLDLCDLKQLVNQPTHLHGHMLDLILSPSDQDTIVYVKICNFVSDHALVKCSIAFPRQLAHIPNKVQYRRYHHIKISDFAQISKILPSQSLQLMLQYVHDLGNVLDRHATLISRLRKRIL